MPELPEVETVCRALARAFDGKKIEKCEVRRFDFRVKTPRDIALIAKDSKIIKIYRRAKYIIFNLDNGYSLIMHLGMSGRVLIIDDYPNELKKHDHVIIQVNDKNALIYNDARRFGGFTYCKTKALDAHELFENVGIEPLSDEFDGKKLKQILKNKTTPIKTALLNQKNVAGIGNIYACEVLYYSKISPLRKANDLSDKEYDLLVFHIKRILKNAIKQGGTTLKDYVQTDGQLGYFVQKLAVYGREGEPCPDCSCNCEDGGIKRIIQSSRSTYYCPRKQV